MSNFYPARWTHGIIEVKEKFSILSKRISHIKIEAKKNLLKQRHYSENLARS